MTEYQIQPITRRCCVTGKELQPGERYFTALVEEGEGFARQDYSVEGWQGPPARAFSFWTGKVPAAQQPARPRIDDDLLEECFQRLEGQAEMAKINFRYVVALLLIRRKRFKFEQSKVEDGMERMVLRDTRADVIHEVVNPRLTEAEMAAVQDEVFKVLGWS